MSMAYEINDGGPAFPSPTDNVSQHGQLSVRDYFAAQAVAGLAGARHDQRELEVIAWRAYQIADAMLEERVKEPVVK